jgi:hypothetical protein
MQLLDALDGWMANSVRVLLGGSSFCRQWMMAFDAFLPFVKPDQHTFSQLFGSVQAACNCVNRQLERVFFLVSRRTSLALPQTVNSFPSFCCGCRGSLWFADWTQAVNKQQRAQNPPSAGTQSRRQQNNRRITQHSAFLMS